MFVSGPQSGSRVELVQETTIGREAEIAIADDEASRRHAKLRPVPGGVEVLDLGSLNGTTVDGDRIGDSPRLAGNGSTIQIGATKLSVEVTLPDPGATRIARAVADDDRTALRARPQFDATVVGGRPPIDATTVTPSPGAAPPPAPAPVEAESKAAGEQQQPKAPPKPVRALLGYLFGAGPEKIPLRMAIVLGSYTIVVVLVTVLVYSLLS